MGKQVFVSLVQVACDNLALNGLLGFVESLSTDFFCTMCYATQDDLQSKFHKKKNSDCDLSLITRMIFYCLLTSQVLCMHMV